MTRNDHNVSELATSTMETDPDPRYAREEYVVAFRHGLMQRFGAVKRCCGHDVEDVVSYATVELLARINQVITRYPDPVEYAGLRFRDVARDYGRRQSAQRGEGARRTRAVGSLDVVARPKVANQLGGSDSIVQVLDDRRRVALVMEALTPREREVLSLCCGHDLATDDVARRLGCARETVSRTLSRAKGAGAKALGPAA
jgi:RNA polymerase sigma factor (sigma-70 family)